MTLIALPVAMEELEEGKTYRYAPCGDEWWLADMPSFTVLGRNADGAVHVQNNDAAGASRWFGQLDSDMFIFVEVEA